MPNHETLPTTLQTLLDFINNNTAVLDKVHVDDESPLSDELHYALSCLDMAGYHLEMALAEIRRHQIND